MLSVEDAQSLILAEITPTPVESIPLAELSGRIVARDIVSQWALPGWDNSAMDGYAVRAHELAEMNNRLPVSDHIAAGDGAERPLAARSAARIFTGALLPKGADTIVVQEDTIRHGDVIEVTCEPRPGQHIRRAGSDIAQDQVIVRRGQPPTG